MAIQRTLPGRTVYLRRPPRRFIVIFCLTLVALTVFLLPSHTKASLPEALTLAEVEQAARVVVDKIPRPKLPKLWHGFGENVHEAREEADSTGGETKRFRNLKWQDPFLASVTLDENQEVPPRLQDRQAIYTFYEPDKNRDHWLEDDQRLLILTWRRAWWAHGFKPIVLGRPEARKSPLFDEAQETNLNPPLRFQVERWLAWSHMEGGILCDWLTFPMGSYYDKTLDFLRGGDYPRLTRFQNLQEGLFVGSRPDIDRAIEKVLREGVTKHHQSILDILSREDIYVESQHGGLALYDVSVTASKYKAVSDSIKNSPALGLFLLQKLINAHLHLAWQNTFPDGVALFQPYPENTGPMMSSASKIAQKLLQCPESPMPDTCPPNFPACKPCTSTTRSHSPELITNLAAFKNTTSAFTIGVVPHPYTFNSMYYSKSHLDAKFVRRQTERDWWLREVTSHLHDDQLSGQLRLDYFKEAIKSSFATSHSLWLTAEPLDNLLDVSWMFGFTLPSSGDETTLESDHESTHTDPSSFVEYLGKDTDTKEDRIDAARQKRLFDLAVTRLQARNGESSRSRGFEVELGQLGTNNKWLSSAESRGKGRDVLEMIEAWNRADSEAWSFVRGLASRLYGQRLEK